MTVPGFPKISIIILDKMLEVCYNKKMDKIYEEPVDFFAGRFSERASAEPEEQMPIEINGLSRRSKIGNMALGAVLLLGVGTVAVKYLNSETSRTIARKATSVLDNDVSITHGSNNPGIAKQRALITQDRTPDVFAFKLEDAPDSTIQTTCKTIEADFKDSPWSVAQHYAVKYSLGEEKVRDLVADIEAATGKVMTENEQFVVCVRPEQQDFTASNN